MRKDESELSKRALAVDQDIKVRSLELSLDKRELLNASEKRDLKQVAATYLNGAIEDTDAFGCVQEAVSEPLRRSREFATAVFDEVAVLLARKYDSHEVDFETADKIANSIEGDMMDLMSNLQAGESVLQIPVDWTEVYEAFDAGEFDHFGRSKDPVAEFTDPAIKDFLARIDNKNR